ncbi:hypothetical protein AOLI_G00294340 [Acnodon oligacanthus]
MSTITCPHLREGFKNYRILQDILCGDFCNYPPRSLGDTHQGWGISIWEERGACWWKSGEQAEEGSNRSRETLLQSVRHTAGTSAQSSCNLSPSGHCSFL